jgi:hypothetical protein
MEINCKCRCFRLLVLVIPDGNVMLSIVDRMVDARCVATTGGRRLFCQRGFATTGGSYACMHNPWIVGACYSYRMRCREQDYVGDNG